MQGDTRAQWMVLPGLSAPGLSACPLRLKDLGSGESKELLQELGLLRAGRRYHEQSPPCQGEVGNWQYKWDLAYKDKSSSAERVPLAQWLRAQAALTEDQHPSTHLVTQNHLNSGPRGSHAFSGLSEHQAYTCCPDTCRQDTHTHKINLLFFF